MRREHETVLGSFLSDEQNRTLPTASVLGDALRRHLPFLRALPPPLF